MHNNRALVSAPHHVCTNQQLITRLPIMRVETVAVKEISQTLEDGLLGPPPDHRHQMVRHQEHHHQMIYGKPSDGDETLATWSQNGAGDGASGLSSSDLLDQSTRGSVSNRLVWLISLLVIQSTSGYILQAFQPIILAHPTLIFYLTTLVGAGGNAGSQSTVFTVRAIAKDQLNERGRIRQFVCRELIDGLKIALVMTLSCWLRITQIGTQVTAVSQTDLVALCASMFIIVFTSITSGTLLPILLWKVKKDPAHACAANQVFADISGVFLTCIVTTIIVHNLSSATITGVPPRPSHSLPT